ncbi:MAG: rhomboid family intramembrane serine protease [Bdellovibrionales bacterium]|nr:rhomboid family intramembrane serine protease [Bdellovibrionales bacterium]
MILPYLNGVLRFKDCPITWLLFIVNAFVMIATLSDLISAQESLDKALKDDYYVTSQGNFYAQFIGDHQAHYSPFMRELSQRAMGGDGEKIKLLGNLALRNEKFMTEALDYPFKGDQVARGWWLEKVQELQEIQDRHPSYILGLNVDHMSLDHWVSYQFVHSGFIHFAFNMIFLFIFGCYLETILGGLAVLVIYLGSGMVAAGTFLLINGASSAPLIGASGAVSGLMALFCFLHWRIPVRCFYWLFIPVKGYSGFVYVPAWIIFFLWSASDLGGYLGSLAEFGGIAYTAHLGGEAAGLITGVVLFVLTRFRPLPPQAESGTSVPFDSDKAA